LRHPYATVNRSQAKAGYSAGSALSKSGMPVAPSSGLVQKADILDVTARIWPDGSLDWTPCGR
jgi:hypothetical protein